MMLTDSLERTRFFRFLVVGALGALIDFGMMNLLTHLFQSPLVIAGTLSFICAVTSNFIWNRYWTYPDSRSRPIGRQLAMFFAVNAAGVAIRVPILKFIEPPLERVFIQQHLQYAGFSAEFLAKNFTLAVAVGVVLLWNFFVNRYWTYNDVS